VRPGVGQHVRHAGRVRVRVDAKQLHLVARGAEQLLGLKHALRGQRADRRALGILEAQHHDLAAELAERHRLAELVDQLDVRGRQGVQRAAKVEVRVHLGGAGGRVGLHAAQRAGTAGAGGASGQRHQHAQQGRSRQRAACAECLHREEQPTPVYYKSS
jgi:hypothetical protein